MFGHDFSGVTAVIFHVRRAHVILQASLDGAGPGNALLQHLDTDAKVGDRVKRRQLAAKVFIFVVMHLGHHLHQALRADRALGKGVETRLDRHDGQNQGGVQFGLMANLKRL